MHHVYRIDKPSAWPAQLCPVSYTRNSCLWKTMDLAAIGPDAQCWNTENFLMKHTTHDASLLALGSTIPPSLFPSVQISPSFIVSQLLLPAASYILRFTCRNGKVRELYDSIAPSV